MEVNENKSTQSSFYPMDMREELPVNFFLGKIVEENPLSKEEEPYNMSSKQHNTSSYPIGTFYKPISNIL